MRGEWAWGWSAVEALATAGALAFSLVAVTLAGLAYKHERDLARRRDEEDRQAQASLVAAWVELEVPPPPASSITENPWLRPGPRHVVLVRNASQLPIFNVFYRLAAFSYDQFGLTQTNRGLFAEVVGPGTDPARKGPSAVLKDLKEEELPFSLERARVELVFMDVAGVVWRRDVFGRLSQHDEFDLDLIAEFYQA